MAIGIINRNDYTGNGATATYPYTFKIFVETDLLVETRDANNIETVLTYPTDYSVSGVGDDNGGSIVLTAGVLANGVALAIRRVRPLTQETILRDQRAFFADENESAFDGMVMIDQQQQDAIDRCLKLPATFNPSLLDSRLPMPTAGQAIAWNSSATGLTNIPTSGITVANFSSKVRIADVFNAGNAGAKIAAAIADLPATGGVVDARGLEGAQAITATIPVGSKNVLLLLGAATFSNTVSMFSITAMAGSIKVLGMGKQKTIIDFTAASGLAIDFNNVDSPELSDLTLKTSHAGNTSTGIRVNGCDHCSLRSIHVDGFATNISITGTTALRAAGHGYDTRLDSVENVNFTTTGILIKHNVDTYIDKSLNWGVPGNPTTAWGLVIDTGTSGVTIGSFSMLYAGMKIQNTAPSASVHDLPPEHLFATALLVDTVTGTDGWLFDATLDTADVPFLNRIGKGYHFVNCWSCFTQTAAKSGIRINGGQDIVILDVRARLNGRHGIHLNGGTNIRIINPGLFGNNTENNVDGSGLYVDAAVIQWEVIGGRSGNTAGEGPNQKYGIKITAVAADQYTLIGVNVSGNVTQGLSDSSTAVNKQIVGVDDYAAGVLKLNVLSSDKLRLQIGDGNSFIDYKNVDPNSVVHSFDAGDYMQYDRGANKLSTLVGATIISELNTNGLGLFGGCTTDAGFALNGTTKGFLLPRLTTVQRDAIPAPTDGLMIYNVTTGKINFHEGVSWHEVTSV